MFDGGRFQFTFSNHEAGCPLVLLAVLTLAIFLLFKKYSDLGLGLLRNINTIEKVLILSAMLIELSVYEFVDSTNWMRRCSWKLCVTRSRFPVESCPSLLFPVSPLLLLLVCRSGLSICHSVSTLGSTKSSCEPTSRQQQRNIFENKGREGNPQHIQRCYHRATFCLPFQAFSLGILNQTHRKTNCPPVAHFDISIPCPLFGGVLTDSVPMASTDQRFETELRSTLMPYILWQKKKGILPRG